MSAADFDASQYHMLTGTGKAVREGVSLYAELVRCPNAECVQSSFEVMAFFGETVNGQYGMRVNPDYSKPLGVGTFRFLPVTASPLSKHVPRQILEDYQEANLILSLSPKASATLSRRALQGMIRDFWQVTKPTLAAELKAIEANCDPELFAAMNALRAIGNIGAHPERDVNLMVDVEPDEAQQLIDLIHLLDSEWYVARASRAQRLAKVQALGEQKKAAQG